jgi:hypothetical protein
MRNNKEIRELQRINRETQERFKALPVRNSFVGRSRRA